MNSIDKESAALFNRGLVELGRYNMAFDEAALTRAVGYFYSATRISPGIANYWVGLGFVLDIKDDASAALAAMRHAAELDPADEEAAVYVLTLLAEAGQETEALSGAEALASRTGVDLESLRRDLIEANMPVNALSILQNGFLRPRNYVRSRLDDAINRAERADASRNDHDKIELKECHDRRAELEREVELESVPPTLHQLIPWVLRLGVGDGPCRSLLVNELTQDEREQALRDFQEYAAKVHAWLDSYHESSLPPEAAAFMYASLAAEEMST